jgi:hypothetical protein
MSHDQNVRHPILDDPRGAIAFFAATAAAALDATADSGTLLLWSERVLGARTLDDVVHEIADLDVR